MLPSNETNTTTDASPSFAEALRKSSILSERQLEKLDAILAEGEYPLEPAELAARLVKDGILTEYQARQVQKGKPQGLVFGSYIILDFLGKGTMGKVYKASHRMMGRVVALKILDPRHVAASPRTLSRFQREMQLVGRLDHPNVVRAYDADKVSDCHFIAMEYADGLTLEDLLKARGALPPADVVYYASQAAEGLAHAHAKGVLHRDIKPSNLLLTAAKKVKVLDFGLGTLLEKDELPTALTTAGITVGTPDFISPEQARMVNIDGRSDLYSLGCTMYYLLSGQLPFTGESSMDCIVLRITGKAVPISEVRPGLPPRLVQAIEKLMATSPDDRYQTADEAAADLKSMLRAKNSTASRPAPPEAVSGPVREPAKKAATPSSVPAVAPVPAPLPKEDKTVDAPLPPMPAQVRLPKPKENALRSRGTSRKVKANRVLAAVAVAAASLIVAAILIFRSSNDDTPVLRQEPSVATNVPERPAVAADVPPPRPVTESPKPAATVGMKAAAPAAPQLSLVIEEPKSGAIVDMREDLTGRIESKGWPVIFVQADIPGQPWWCQAPVTSVDDGRFTAKVVFGDEFTPSGTRYRIAGIVTSTREEALKFNVGAKEQTLPKGYPHSAEVIVTHR
jgi:eukaryotic-like serine/threonine-protein kinase